MDIYLVGGAVRDELLGLPVTERDWVVVGATPEELEKLGFKSVGRDFPVFLHPETGEEYALARTERKTGRGHRGFDCDSSPDVTLEDDLKRRDLTVNAIARDPAGKLIDPYGGIKDLRERILRHVSSAFEEDPLRVLRAARFQARLDHLGFELHESTLSLLRHMVARGDLAELTPERVFAELEKALQTDDPAVFFRQLAQIGANRILWPDITDESLELLSETSRISADPTTRFAVLGSRVSEDHTAELCKRLKAPSKYSELAVLLSRFYEKWTNVLQMTAAEIVDALNGIDAFRRSERFSRVAEVCRLIESVNNTEHANEKHAIWIKYHQLALSVRAEDISGDVKGAELGKAIRQRQVELIARNQHHE